MSKPIFENEAPPSAATIESLLPSVLVVRKKHCPKHGEFSSTNYVGKIWSMCPKCIAEEREQEDASAKAEARERANRAWINSLGQSQIPLRFKDRTLATYKADNEGQRIALRFATEYAENFALALKTGRSAMFIGLAGTGKTHLAAGVALEVMKADKTALFTTVQRAIRRIKDTWHKGSKESETQAVAAFVYPDLLVLDEVGVQFGSETEKNILFDILNDRYERCKPTLLLSNLTLDEVKPFLGERVFDRLREAGGECIVFNWESHRGK